MKFTMSIGGKLEDLVREVMADRGVGEQEAVRVLLWESRDSRRGPRASEDIRIDPGERGTFKGEIEAQNAGDASASASSPLPTQKLLATSGISLPEIHTRHLTGPVAQPAEHFGEPRMSGFESRPAPTLSEPVAQRTERPAPTGDAGGSNPSGLTSINRRTPGGVVTASSDGGGVEGRQSGLVHDAAPAVEFQPRPAAKQRGSRPTIGPRFEAFWAAWPPGRRAHRKPAEEAWAKRERQGRLPPVDQEVGDLVLLALAEELKGASWAAGFEPMPSTWLNQDRDSTHLRSLGWDIKLRVDGRPGWEWTRRPGTEAASRPPQPRIRDASELEFAWLGADEVLGRLWHKLAPSVRDELAERLNALRATATRVSAPYEDIVAMQHKIEQDGATC